MPIVLDGTTGITTPAIDSTAPLSDADIPNLDASKITTGTVATARLASGTANNTTFLRGDSTWTTVDVLATIAGSTVGAVGTYAFLRHTSNADYAPGDTLAGSSLRYAGIAALNWFTYTATTSTPATVSPVNTTTSPSGTWRCMGIGSNIPNNDCTPATMFTASLWLRIS